MERGKYAGSGGWPYGGPGPSRPATGWTTGWGEPAGSGGPAGEVPPARRRSRRRDAVVAGVAAVVVATVAAVAVVAWPSASHGATKTPVASTSASPTASSGGSGTSSAADSARDTALVNLLAARAKALSSGDLAGWLAGVDPQQPALVAHQRMLFTNLRKLPLADFRWVESDANPLGGYDVPATMSVGFVGADATYSGAYVLHYRFRGYDSTDILDPYAPVFLRRAGTWLLAGDQTTTQGDTFKIEPWDHGLIAVGTGKHSLVVVSASDAKRLRGMVQQADAAVGRVAAMWPSAWAGHVVVYDTRDASVFSGVLGVDVSATDFGGVTTSMTGNVSATRNDDLRVVVNSAYSPPGSSTLPAVLTHEFTHVAKWVDVSDGTPIWAIEGIAEYTAYRGHPQDQRVTGKIGTDGRAGRLPRTLPRSGGFYSEASEQVDYGMAWLAFEYLKETYGESKVRMLYERLAKITAPADSPAALKAEGRAFQAVVHVSEAKFVSGLNHWIAQVIRPVH
jgi:hypothetical protein